MLMHIIGCNIVLQITKGGQIQYSLTVLIILVCQDVKDFLLIIHCSGRGA